MSSTIEYQAGQTIIASSRVTASTGHIFYYAGRSISLNPGFQTAVSGNGFFEAAIRPCVPLVSACGSFIDFEDCTLSSQEAIGGNPLVMTNVYPMLGVHSGSPNIERPLGPSQGGCSNPPSNPWRFPLASTLKLPHGDVFDNNQNNAQYLAMFFAEGFFGTTNCNANQSQGETMFIHGPFEGGQTYRVELDMRVMRLSADPPSFSLDESHFTEAPDVRFILVNNIINNGRGCTDEIPAGHETVWELRLTPEVVISPISNNVFDALWTHQIISFRVPSGVTYSDLWLRGATTVIDADGHRDAFVLHVDNIRVVCGDDNSGPMGIGNLPLKQKINQRPHSLSPNPTATRFTLNGIDDLSHTDIQVYDITGRSVKQYRKPATAEFDVSDLPTGIYIVKIMTDNKLFSTHKLTISR